MAHHEIKRRSSNPGEFSADDSARKNTAIIDGVAGDFPPQPERAQIRTIDWDELYGINYLRHGTGTTLFSGFLCNASDETVGGGEGGKEAGGGGGGGGSGGGGRCLEAIVVKCPKWGLSAAEREEVTTELRHEAEMLARFHHPNIIPLTGIGTLPLRDGSSVFFLAVPLLVGGCLSHRLETSAGGSSSQKDQAKKERALALSTLASRGNKDPPEDAALPPGFKRKTFTGGISTVVPPAVPPPPPQASKRGGQMPLSAVLRAAEELASALQYLHDTADESGVVLHRDLKPDNIGFSGGQDDRVLLFDFGLVTSIPRTSAPASPKQTAPPPPQSNGTNGALPPCSSPTGGGGGSSGGGGGGLPEAVPGTVVVPLYRLPKYRLTGHTGSVRYMAPEVALDKPYNQSVDTYSFSIILWEMTYRKRPFAGMNVNLHRELVCLKGERPELDKKALPDLADLLRGCWHADSDRRPPFHVIKRRLQALRKQVDSPESSGGQGPNGLRRGASRGGGRSESGRSDSSTTSSPSQSPNSSMRGGDGSSWSGRAARMFTRKGTKTSSSWF
eukprot:CAMPEP_0171830246 /NCGR_PEP_ID=MMETSP0992-20121227/8131_1 /TAXON_ID=483369 /ORGANISM="non described non described, Strain CCMP2098" /LENGTH=557 /DNA_ID=CAMNT_0012445557 /DNA_START=325 /DNA_END=1998 /DNA_ORIENTATION=-